MPNTQLSNSPKTAFSGTVICIGSAIGAGIFSLPTVSSGMWLYWSIACLLVTAFATSSAALMILRVNLNFEPGDSFDTLIKSTLGRGWNIFNGLLFVFLLYILDYAYISGGGSIVSQTSVSLFGVELPHVVASLVFAISLAFVVWLSTAAVSKVTAVFLFGMIVSFILVMFDLSFTINWSRFTAANAVENDTPRFYYVFAALPFYLTSFTFTSVVPSLVAYYGKRYTTISRSILIASLGCLIIYLVFLLVSFGNVPQTEFREVSAAGGNIGDLLEVLMGGSASTLLSIFANAAIISSFLAVSLGLFDFIKDRFDFDNSKTGRFKTALISFMPPIVGGVFFPDGFLHAIGFAGLVLAINALIIPPLMIKKSKQQFKEADHGSFVGSNFVIHTVIALGVFYASCHILAMLNLLPVYK
jgi:tryptophan-specific transport protein